MGRSGRRGRLASHPAVDDRSEASRGEGAQVVLDGVPPAHDDTGGLEPVEHPDGENGLREGVQQRLPGGDQGTGVGQFDEVLYVVGPPRGECCSDLGFVGPYPWIFCDERAEVGVRQVRREVHV
jgi:hypothetical protein